MVPAPIIDDGRALNVSTGEFAANTVAIYAETKAPSVQSSRTPANDRTRFGSTRIDPGRDGNRVATQDPYYIP